MDETQENEHLYDDIIELPHHVSAVHPQMARRDRAAQFASFAAVKGFDAGIRAKQDLEDEKTELDF